MKTHLRIFFVLGFLFILPSVSMADLSARAGGQAGMILKTEFKTWEINPSKLDFFSDYQKTGFSGLSVSIKKEDEPLTSGLLKQETVQGLDSIKIRDYLQKVIAPDIYREKTPVSIDMDKDGKIHFEGTGFYGRQLDVQAATKMMEYALNHQMTYVHLPILRDEPEVKILNPELEKMGIKELVSGGETDFSHSPANRIVNIKAGLSKFMGHIVKPGEEFVFGNILGPVDASTGYLKELVIKGNKTVPDYGGGLCQVSTTAYRAALAAGFPVTARRNHSYAVSYYKPLGLDATVYPPTVDMKFMNDTPNYLIMQSFNVGEKAYYNYYGTKTNRKVEMIGPYYSAWTPAPAKKIEYAGNMAPGETKVVGHAVPGVNVTWYRYVTYPDQMVTDPVTKEEKNKSFLETIYSKYQARPDYVIMGKAAEVAQEMPAVEVKP